MPKSLGVKRQASSRDVSRKTAKYCDDDSDLSDSGI